MSDSGPLRACFTGYYGMHNFGDDLFGQLCNVAAPRYWRSEAMLAGPAIAGVDARYTMPAWYPSALYGASGAPGKASRLYSFARALRQADVLVMGGGSVIGAHESFRKPMMLSAQRRGRIALAAVGVSIGPFDDTASEASAAAFVERFAYVSVRDRRSYAWASRMGLGDKVKLSRDLAGLLPLLAPLDAHSRTADHDRPLRIGVAPCNYGERRGYATPDRQAITAALAEALTGLAAQRPLQVEVFSLNEHDRHGDFACSEALRGELRQRQITVQVQRYRGCSPLSMAQAIGRCDVFVSARLHGAIVAYLQGVPFAIIDYHPKCNDFADDISLGTLRRITAQRQDTDAFGETLQALLDGDGAPSLSREIYTRQAQDIFQCAPWATRM